MGDFLAANNICGQNLLRLVSRGNAIIAELMRLKDYVPPVFSLDSKQMVQKYGSIIIDFAYFKSVNIYEQKIENDPVLQETDEELRNNYSDIISRFYSAFEGIHKYVTDLNLYMDELGDGIYIHQSIDSIMLNEEGRQLMCEAVYLYGVMLLLVDHHFEGCIRERLLVSYYRYNAQRSSYTSVDDICMLLRSTGFSKTSNKRPSNYPEEYFKRIPLNESLIEHLIGRLRSDEIYNQSLAYPHPEHRSTALCNQASMLVIILSFKPAMLHTHTAIMREIVDRFFPDNWVISIYMGIVINLCDWWSPYKAAKTALNNTLESSNVKVIAQKYGQKLKKLISETEEVQLAVTFDESAVGSLVKLIKESNVTLHWILLHTAMPTISLEDSKRVRMLRQLVLNESKYTITDCLQLLLSTAQIEQDVKQLYKDLLIGKETKWLRDKGICVERITDLAQIFGGNKSLDGIEKNKNLHSWFMVISKHIESLQQEDGRKIVLLLQALEEVLEFHQLENNLHISQYLADTREILHNMIRTGSITEDTMISLNIVTDCCYAWNIMESFIETMQASIKESPPTVIKLKALFLKMASALETPLLRVNQARSADLSSVSQYYSRELEKYARHVLQIIPETVFGLLAQIVYLETNAFKEIPTKLPKDKLKEYAQLDDRLKMAKLTYAVSVFTKGVLSLRSVPLGVLRVDSHRLLEDGIRQELVKKVTVALDNGLVFEPKSKTTILQKLDNLAAIMDGYRKSFQYIQDYININSLKIWHEEITYIISNAVEDECTDSSWIPERSWRYFQEEKHVPVLDNNSVTFIGRLARELTRITEPRTTVYIEHSLAWYDLKTQAEVLNYKIFSKILEAIGTPGLTGLDKLISFYIVTELNTMIRYIEKNLRNKTWASILDHFEPILNSADGPKGNTPKLHAAVATHTNKFCPQLLEWMLKIGHCQLLKKNIAYELNTACKFEAKHMEAALQTMNTAILLEIGKGNDSDQNEPERSELLRELNVRLDWAGISDPHKNVYIKSPNINNIALIMFILTVSQLPKVHYCRNTGSLLSKKAQDSLDAVIFAIGVQTVLRQCRFSAMTSYVKYLCAYISSSVTPDSVKTGSDGNSEGANSLHFLELFIKYSGLPRSFILKEIPVIVMDHFQAKTAK
ncbi:PREDICTED: WASH complex subunit strumpellin [Dufourea novaeangliae]|uniref:WASH complex subunit strumpellin n=1 Tax=Dufourea novaeangliae TaxID=178035 RepID=A0A154NZM9_DUFNO|nr:PREDICTED: WASH complex subunit strumpellin [Dufourea novaeangliae]KZC05129.1 WASH complex subunit strumpellin [Dufourea novaeangliae]